MVVIVNGQKKELTYTRDNCDITMDIISMYNSFLTDDEGNIKGGI